MSDSRELLAQARAIHLAMHHGAISYEEAKRQTKPLLEQINKKVIEIARKYRQKPRPFKFQDLERSF